MPDPQCPRSAAILKSNRYAEQNSLQRIYLGDHAGLNRRGQDDGAGKRANGDYVLCRRPNNSDVLDWIRSIDTAGSDGCKAAAPKKLTRMILTGANER